MSFGGGVFRAVEVVEESSGRRGSGGGSGSGALASFFEFLSVFDFELDLGRFSPQHFGNFNTFDIQWTNAPYTFRV